MALRSWVGGIAAAALAIGALAGCSDDEGGTEGEDDNASVAQSPPPESEPSEPSMPPSDAADGEGEDGDGGAAAEELQGTIDQLLEESPISFESRGAELDSESENTLQQIADAASDAEDATLEITTSAGGTDEAAADQLSEDRLTAVVDALTANGVEEDRIQGNASGLQEDDILGVEISAS